MEKIIHQLEMENLLKIYHLSCLENDKHGAAEFCHQKRGI